MTVRPRFFFGPDCEAWKKDGIGRTNERGRTRAGESRTSLPLSLGREPSWITNGPLTLAREHSHIAAPATLCTCRISRALAQVDNFHSRPHLHKHALHLVVSSITTYPPIYKIHDARYDPLSSTAFAALDGCAQPSASFDRRWIACFPDISRGKGCCCF